jgi:acetaldehyde dehydrogenase
MPTKTKVAVIGPGNIGSDLMYKIMRTEELEMAMMAGIVESEGIRRARMLNVPTSIGGIEAILADPGIKIVFEATTAAAHLEHAPLLKEAGKVAIDLTPAAIGPYVVPAVNLEEVKKEPNLNMVTCGGQSTVPIAKAITRVLPVTYCEIIASIASKSAGPGTRRNIDEFTETTAKSLKLLGGAGAGKAIIILNPAEPPKIMINTIFAEVEGLTEESQQAIRASVERMVAEIRQYVPGYRLRVPPLFEGQRVTVIIEVEGAGDFLPAYAGNIDIINCAAVAVARKLALAA